MKETAAAIQPGTAALFVLVRKVTADKVLEGLKGEGGTVMKTSLDHTKEAALQAASRCERRNQLAMQKEYRSASCSRGKSLNGRSHMRPSRLMRYSRPADGATCGGMQGIVIADNLPKSGPRC
jgi:hypothetical protein